MSQADIRSVIRVASLRHWDDFVDDRCPRIKERQAFVDESTAKPAAILLDEDTGAKLAPAMSVGVTRVARYGSVHMAIRLIIIISGTASGT